MTRTVKQKLETADAWGERRGYLNALVMTDAARKHLVRGDMEAALKSLDRARSGINRRIKVSEARCRVAGFDPWAKAKA